MAEGVRRLLETGSVSLQPYIKLPMTRNAKRRCKLSDAELTEVETELGNAELPHDRDDLAELRAGP